jgi:hypothetical protein
MEPDLEEQVAEFGTEGGPIPPVERVQGFVAFLDQKAPQRIVILPRIPGAFPAEAPHDAMKLPDRLDEAGFVHGAECYQAASYDLESRLDPVEKKMRKRSRIP